MARVTGRDDIHAATPRSSPIISHATFIGGKDAAETQNGWLLRRGTEVQLHNSIVTGFDTCVDVDSAETFRNAEANPASFTFTNNLFYCPDGKVFAGTDPKNPLGSHWIDLGESYGIHGTIEPTSIGKSESLGCIRMHTADVEIVYDLLTIGSEVVIQR